MIQRVQHALPLIVLFFSSIAYSCTKTTNWSLGEWDIIEDAYLDTIPVIHPPYREWDAKSTISIRQFGPLNFGHQSAAAYKDYAFFVTKGRSQVCLYSLTGKRILFTLTMNRVNGEVYHCNQSTFGFEKYDPNDFFPLLYVSQRAKTDGRCFIEVYRVFPMYNEDLSEFDSFYLELVQTIFLPKLSDENSLGNANCVIDVSSRIMYVYSRNTNSKAENYGKCVVSRFDVPDLHQKTVILNDKDILSSFMVEANAVNMQGGCIQDGILYIGQGLPSAGYIYLNIIDLEKEELVKRVDLREYRVIWEPEGCFFYDGSVMLAYTSAICRIDKQ